MSNSASATGRGVVWLVSQVYGQQESSTGSLLEQLVGGLRAQYRIEVVTSTDASPAVRPATPAVRREAMRGGVEAVKLVWMILRKARRDDVVIGLTNPPLLPAALGIVALLRRFKLIVLIHDVYPEALYAVEPSARHLIPAVFDRVNTWALRRADRVIVIGRDMQRLILAKLQTAPDHVVFIPNWPDIGERAAADAADARAIPAQRPLIVQYSGKLGVTHNPSLIARAAAVLQQRGVNVRFHVYTWGANVAALRAMIAELGLSNIEIFDPCPHDQLPQQLASCDIGLIVMRPAMAGVSVPCRLYNLLAMGKPVVAAVERESEIGMVLRDAKIGWLADPADAASLADAIATAEANRADLEAMRTRALALALNQYSFAQALNRYQSVIEECVTRS